MDKLYCNFGGECSFIGEDKLICFEDVIVIFGIVKKWGFGLGVMVGDFNLDGWIDFYVVNDGVVNFMWIN